MVVMVAMLPVNSACVVSDSRELGRQMAMLVMVGGGLLFGMHCLQVVRRPGAKKHGIITCALVQPAMDCNPCCFHQFT
jgi:hypothetical protein